MSDPFQGYGGTIDGPATRHFAITPSDTVDMAIQPRAIYCIADGNAVVRDGAGTTITYPVTNGMYLIIRAVRILATGTTASLVGLY